MVDQHREDERYDVELDVSMHGVDSDAEAVKVLNVSTLGCRFTSRRKMAVGSPVTVVVPRVGEVSARVRWRVGKMHGVRFDQALQRTVLDHIRLFLSTQPAYVAERD